MSITISSGNSYKIYAGRKLPDVLKIENIDNSYQIYFLAEEGSSIKLYLIKVKDANYDEKVNNILANQTDLRAIDKIIYMDLSSQPSSAIYTNVSIFLTRYELNNSKDAWVYVDANEIEVTDQAIQIGQNNTFPFWANFNFIQKNPEYLSTFYLSSGTAYSLHNQRVIEWEETDINGGMVSVDNYFLIDETIYNLKNFSPKFYCRSTNQGMESVKIQPNIVKEDERENGWYIDGICYMPYEKNVKLNNIVFEEPGLYLSGKGTADSDDLFFIYLFSLEETPWAHLVYKGNQLGFLENKITKIADNLRKNLGIEQKLTLDEMADLIFNFKIKPINIFPYSSFEFNTNDIFFTLQQEDKIQITIKKDAGDNLQEAERAYRGKCCGSLTCVNPVTGDYVGRAAINFTIAQPGHYYYFQAKIKSNWNDEDTNRSGVFLSRILDDSTSINDGDIAFGEPLENQEPGEWYTIGGIYFSPEKTSPEDISVYNLILGMQIGVDSTDNSLQIDEVLVVDLTEDFGAGKEPNLKACKQIFKDYISDSVICDLPDDFWRIISDSNKES